MDRKIEKLFRAPYSVPNGIQMTGEGLWVVDQVTDRVALVEVVEANEYGVTRMIAEISSESSNTSGMTCQDDSLWLAANGRGDRWRQQRSTDAEQGAILKVNSKTGETLLRYALPGGGGTHGLEYDSYEEGTLWLTTLKSQTLTQVQIEDWSSLRVLQLPYSRAHGVVRVMDGIWVVHTGERVIVKLDLDGEGELDRIEVAEPYPEPHGLSICEGGLLYCDATSGWIAKIFTEV